jgi:plastocyanin
MQFNQPKTCESSLKRKRSFATSVALGLLIVGASGVRAQDPAVVVKMNDMPASFEPKEVTIKVGETVEWKNVGNSVHHASSDPSMAMKPGDAITPSGAKAFDSGFLRPGDTYSFKFTEPGVYNYVCAPHETSGMTGRVTVLPGNQASR